MYDVLIIGQGLAGSLLAWHLLQRNQSVMVVDSGLANTTSRVAAGLINPVTGMRLVKTPGADDYLPAARACYRQLEAKFARPFLHEKPMLRLIRNEKERQVLSRRRDDPGYQAYLGQSHAAGSQAPFADALGSFEQQQTGYLDTVPLLDSLSDWLREQRHMRVEDVEVASLEIRNESVRLGDMAARRVIFCEGYRAMHNPWFDWLPFQPARGEILALHLHDVPHDRIINGGRWLLPLHDGRTFRLGASYDRENLHEGITETARDSLLQDMQSLFVEPQTFELLGQQTGIRPCTRDTLPFIGTHPRQPRLLMFNGFGSKGSMMIPWHAERLTAHLLDGQPLPAEADIRRYWP